MKAKEFLKNIIHMDMMIDCKLEQIAELRSRLTSVSCATDNERVQTSLKGDKFIDTFARIEELEKLVNNDIDVLVEYKKQAREMIEKLESDVEKIVLYKRYFECKSFEQIAVECNYSWRHVHRIHGNALVNLEKLIECHSMSY